MWQIISSSQPNSPVVAGENGQLLTMLDACLIDGFNSQTASSYQDGVLTFGIFHGYIKNQYITISDNSGQANYRIKDVSDNQVVLYDKPNLQGVITTKITPLGWESMDKTPIQALTWLTETAGGFINTHPFDDVIIAKQNYPNRVAKSAVILLTARKKPIRSRHKSPKLPFC
ncbi:hypothetical protein [Moraxella bovis]|uniref:Uncharacterized protein n=1 Tax=Moraxella bovis TaxID=476 RepID=A0A378Q082_MORBO|nr:hypothetical protein [Moraxella bovis]STY93804.1 Uncharacterised protein [Moraxella bovis]